MSLKSLDSILLNSLNYRYKKIYDVAVGLQSKIYFLNFKSTLNNLYINVTNNFGRTVILKSGGMLKLTNSKRNTTYILELMLLEITKKLLKNRIKNVILKLDLINLKKKKTILKILMKYKINIIGIQVTPAKSFNGVRAKKQRRI
jgi:ribosomal protein S11